MSIKIVEEYDTQVHMDRIRSAAQKKETTFLSGWTKGDNNCNFDNEFLLKSIGDLSNVNKYVHGDKAKKEITRYLNYRNIPIEEKNMRICSNGTLAMFLSLLEAKEQSIKNILFIGPIFFSYYNIAKDCKYNVYNYSIDFFRDLPKNITNEVSAFLSNNNISCVIITQPFFGVGQNLSLREMKLLMKECSEKGVLFILDNVYGNMDWEHTGDFVSCELVHEAINHSNCLVIESITKNLFLNGLKSAVIFGCDERIRSIQDNVYFYAGTITCVQDEFLYQIFKPENENRILRFIHEGLDYAKDNYYMTKSMFEKVDKSLVKLVKTDSGYFCLAGISKKLFKSENDNDIAWEIHENTDILTLPHSRYYCTSEDFYIFRINLSLDKESIKHSILSLCNMIEKKTFKGNNK